MSGKIKTVYVSSVDSVHADPDTGEVYYMCNIEGKEVHVVMDMYEAIHLHDKEYIKECLIKYIKKQ